MASFCLFGMILFVIFHKHGRIIFRRILFIVGILYWLRSLSLLCTQLPPGYIDVHLRCLEQLEPEKRTWKSFLSRMFGMGAHVGLQVS